ncbi:MAG: response regulator transcription factor [Anaerolineae bacterium]|nr:response regulator transcription factor [Anaerolineae bacterium]
MKILLVEDDLALSDVVSFTLRRAGYDVQPAYDGAVALELFESGAPDLVLLDLNLPKLDGLGVCRRIRAVMRRAGVQIAPATLAAQGLVLDRSRGEVQLGDGPPVHLTGLEAKLLEALMREPGRVMAADALIAAVWGPEGGDRTMLKQLVYRLRAKIEDEEVAGFIETVPGIGYAFGGAE